MIKKYSAKYFASKFFDVTQADKTCDYAAETGRLDEATFSFVVPVDNEEPTGPGRSGRPPSKYLYTVTVQRKPVAELVLFSTCLAYTLLMNTPCFFCQGPAHPATGHAYTERVLACRECTRNAFTFVAEHTNKKGRRKTKNGHPCVVTAMSFYEAATKNVPP